MNIPFRLLIAVAISVASCCVTAITHAERVSLTPAGKIWPSIYCG